MLQSLKQDVAYRLALRKAVQRRPAGRSLVAVRRPRILITVPHLAEDENAVWHFISKVRVRVDDLILVRCSSLLTHVPARFVGHVDVITAEDYNWLGLPKRQVVNQIWQRKPDVALDLHCDFNLAASYIAGASPSTCRIGFFHPEREPFLDFMIRTDLTGRRALETMENYLRSVLPEAVPIEP